MVSRIIFDYAEVQIDEQGYTIYGMERPNDITENYFGNLRIFVRFNDYLGFTITENLNLCDDDTSEAFFFSHQQAYAIDEAMELFDYSEYSFVNMLSSLGEVAQKEIAVLLETPYKKKNFENFLLTADKEAYKNTQYFFEIMNFIYNWSIKDFTNFFMRKYASVYNHHNYVSLIKDRHFFFEMNKLSRNWKVYEKEIANKTKFSKFISDRRNKNSQNYSYNYKYFSDMVEVNPIFDKNMIEYIDDYMKRLSACMLLPSDKEARPEEQKLIEAWLRMFDNFYPEYERLLSWYKENNGV